VNIHSVELKDLNLPEGLKRTIGKQAEAEREKRAKVIDAEGELLASKMLADAAGVLSNTPGALHLRTLQSINDISSDQSNTTVWMVPIETLRALEGLSAHLKK
jgi:regulator of protease activity HflC (stomatin/prohibitin superfamily)